MTNMLPVVMVGIAVALVAGILVFANAQEKKRIEAMRQAAMMTGFQFEDRLEKDALETLVGELPLFRRGHSRKATSVMRGKKGDQSVVLMDYQFTTGGGKNSHTHHQTVALFPEGAGGLPDFEVGPENFLHRIGQAFGYQDIDFEEDEDFSKKYLLRGEDEAGIRRVFGSNVRMTLSSLKGWSAEVKGGTLAAYRSNKRCQPDGLTSYLAEAARIQNTLKPE
jgi:hypothetical protein